MGLLVVALCLPAVSSAEDRVSGSVLIDGCVPLKPGPLRRALDWELGPSTQRYPEVVTACEDGAVRLTWRRWENDPQALSRSIQLPDADDEARRRWFVVAVVELVEAGTAITAPDRGRGIVPVSHRHVGRILDLAAVDTSFKTPLVATAAPPRQRLAEAAVVLAEPGTEGSGPPAGSVSAPTTGADAAASAGVAGGLGEGEEELASSGHRLVLTAALHDSGDVGALGGGLAYEWQFSSSWALRLGASTVLSEGAGGDLGAVDTELYALDAGLNWRTQLGPLGLGIGAGGHLGLVAFTGVGAEGFFVDVGPTGEEEVYETRVVGTDGLLPFTALLARLDLDYPLSPSIGLRLGFELGYVTLPATALRDDQVELSVDGLWSRAQLGVGWNF